MDLKAKILEHLADPKRDFLGNLTYGMKLWKSPSFYYMSKYDIVFNFFLDNVVSYFSTIKRLDRAEFDARWQTINSFLLLPCPANALPATIARRLKQCLKSLHEQANERREQLLETFLIVAFDAKYKNFYKFDYQAYGSVLCLALEYYKTCLLRAGSIGKEMEEKIVDRIFADIKIYAKSAAGSSSWNSAFDTFLTPLAEVVLLLEERGVMRREELLALFEQHYFTHDSVSKYNRIEPGSAQQQSSLFMGSFDVQKIPLHVIALLMEGFIRAYRDLKLEVLLFLKYFLQNVFVESKRSILVDSRQVYALTKCVFRLLRKYFIMVDQQLMVDFNFTDILTEQLKRQLELLCATSETAMRDFFELICTINEYNPLVLEHSIVDIILRVMFTRKGPETLRSYQTMLMSTVSMFMKLNKSENLCDELFMKLSDYLEENELEEVLRELRKGSGTGKRKNEHVSANKTPAKKVKLSNGSAVQLNGAVSDPTDTVYWRVLFSEQGNSTEAKRRAVQQRAQVQHNCWPELTFAWPDADGRLGETMKEYTKQLLTKRSLSYWKKFMILLTELLELAEEPSEGTLFQIELALCWMCYFFSGNTLIEHSNLFWPRLVSSMQEFDQLLGTIGRKLLPEGKNLDKQLYGAFLNVVYYYGNYRMMVFYYRPDSIEESNYEQLYGYLGEPEWRMIEQHVPAKDIPLLNRVLLQKLRLPYFKQEQEEREQESHVERHRIVGRILNNKTGERFRPLLLDRSTNVWFLGLMDREQRRHVASLLLDCTYCPLEDVQHILAEVASDHDLLEVFLLGAYGKMADLLATVGGSAATLNELSFETLLEQEEGAIVPQLRKRLERCASKRNVETITLPEPIVDGLGHLLDLLDEIRIDSYEQGKKSLLVAAHLLLLAHLMNASNAQQMAERFKGQLIRFMLLGTATSMSALVSVETLFQLFGVSPVVIILLQQLVEHLTEQTFGELKSILANFSPASNKHFELLLLIHNFEQRNLPRSRKSPVAVEERIAFLDDMVNAIDKYLLLQDGRKQRKKDAEGFNLAVKACLTTIRHKAERQVEMDDALRDHVLGYIKQAMKVFTHNADMLLTRALIHKDYLQLEPATVSAIEEKCWQTFLTLMQERTAAKEQPQEVAQNEENPSVSKSDEQLKRIETIITALVAHFTEEQYAEKLNLLNRIEFTASHEQPGSTAQPLKTTLAVFSILSKKGLPSTVSKETCKVFVRSFAAVVARDLMGLCVLSHHLRDAELLDTVLECFGTIIGNRKLALFPALLDYVLQFLSAISIRKRTSIQTDDEQAAFFKLHRAMGQVMYGLLQARSMYVASRLPSYMHVYEALLGALICYKGDAALGKSLTSFEILTISDLLLPLQRIVNIACKKLQKQLYLLAPYVLGQILHTIVQCKRATTEHNRIASNVHSVCFSLIAIYDSHAPSYLLRTLDESSRLLFTDITKRYERRTERFNSHKVREEPRTW
uniref:Nucleolar 27S pre-rRNA processing Urb2/Npa2 C-terminal domain-containing protein n=1 Tax=Anopheles coluzzii TaxID=1518534 RepID=A0A8W7Q0J8_ANOCL